MMNMHRLGRVYGSARYAVRCTLSTHASLRTLTYASPTPRNQYATWLPSSRLFSSKDLTGSIEKQCSDKESSKANPEVGQGPGYDDLNFKRVIEEQSVLWSWILANTDEPMPSKEVLEALAEISGLDTFRITIWIKNTMKNNIREVSLETLLRNSGKLSVDVTPYTLQMFGVPDVESLRSLFVPWESLKADIDRVIARRAKIEETEQDFGTNDNDNVLEFFDTDHEMQRLDKNSLYFKLLQEEPKAIRITGRDAPECLTSSQWKKVVVSPKLSKREATYGYLASTRRKIEKEREQRAALLANENDDDPGYRFNVYHVSVKKIDLSRTYNTVLHGPDLVLDATFSQRMNHIEIVSLKKQVAQAVGHCKNAAMPVHLRFTGFEPASMLGQHFNDPCFLNVPFISFAQQGFEELYDPAELVYLSPDASDVLYEYNPRDTYIIGALVDLIGAPRISYSKARELGIRMARLPLDEYARCSGSKYLTVSACISILVDKMNGQSWTSTFEQHLPKRIFTMGETSKTYDKSYLGKAKKEMRMKNIYKGSDAPSWTNDAYQSPNLGPVLHTEKLDGSSLWAGSDKRLDRTVNTYPSNTQSDRLEGELPSARDFSISTNAGPSPQGDFDVSKIAFPSPRNFNLSRNTNERNSATRGYAKKQNTFKNAKNKRKIPDWLVK